MPTLQEKQAETVRQLKKILKAMDYVSKHGLGRMQGGRERQAQLQYDIYQAMGAAWHYYGLMCAHRKGYRRVSKTELACRLCGHIKGSPVNEYLIPTKGVKTIGRFVPAPRLNEEVRQSKHAAALVRDKIRFHGTELSVNVHHAYPSRLFKSKISVAAGREIALREKEVEVFIDDYLIGFHFLKKPKTGQTHRLRNQPVYGAFPNELPKRVLSKFPVMFSYDSKGRLEGIEIFRPRPR